MGILLVVTGTKDTYKALGAQLYSDFAGTGGFMYWILAVGIIGAIGYYSPAQKFSRLFLALLIIVFILANKGLFAQLQQGLASGPVQAASNAPPTPQDIPLHLSGLGGTPIPIKIQGSGGAGGIGGGGMGGLGALAGMGG